MHSIGRYDSIVGPFCFVLFFITPQHMGSHTPSSEDFSPLLEWECLLCTELIMEEVDIPRN